MTQITNVWAGVAVRDLDGAKRWYGVFFARPGPQLPPRVIGNSDTQNVAQSRKEIPCQT